MSSAAAEAPRLGAADACVAQRDFAALKVDRQGLFWVEYNPADGCNRIVRHRHGRSQVLTPGGFSVRSRVHEYGGGAWCLADDRLVFVNDSDQQLWLQPLSPQAEEGGCPPLRLTATTDTRFGDLLYDPHRRRIIAVAERHGDDGVVNSLVAVSLGSGRVQCLARGHDFYSSPCLSPNGRSLAWLTWDHPDQPWTRNRLYCAPLDREGRCLAPRLLAGQGNGEALFQPGFDAAGVLHVVSDRSGWWNLYRLTPGGRWHNVCPLDAEFGVAQWQLGLSTWVAFGDGCYGCSLVENGEGRLRLIQPGSAAVAVAEDYRLFRSLCCDEHCLYSVAEAPDRTVSILAIERQSGEQTLIAGGTRPDHRVSLPQPFSCPVGDGERVHGFSTRRPRRRIRRRC
ncbi:hypothetical protein [Marinobacterium aestuariivivens]|uniref:Uncharacterized protein n=1 Tax=Marinobacterium aestuariivivens TaxID=1698799 RepID=A0ABW2A653_9GAMM